jgi:hypothetical protein
MKASYNILEVRFQLSPNWTKAYVLCGPASDGTLGIQGWHTKTFPPDVSVQDILMKDIAEGLYLTEWDVGAPSDV